MPPPSAEHFTTMVELAHAHGIHYTKQTGRRPIGKLIGMNGWPRDYAEKSGSVYLSLFAALAEGRELKKEYTDDGFLPNAKGYAAIGPVTEEATARALGAEIVVTRSNMHYTRRDMGRIAAATLPFAMGLQAKPDSKIGGVEVGTISYSFREMPDGNNAEAILKHMVELGLSGIELMNGPAEAWAGAPAPAGRGARGATPTPEQIEAQKKATGALKDWRLSVSMDKYKALRKLYNDAGVNIYAFKLGLSLGMSNEEYEYTFNVAEALGANHLTMELPTDSALTKRVGEFAAKRKLYVGYHAHTQATPTLWDEALSQSKYNAINLDLGHYTAGTNASPIPFLMKNHARIVSMHMKDRKYEKNGDNLPWGQGETPIKEALQLMKKEKYKFPATIELEYRTPEGSTVMAEMAKCLQYCKDALA